MKDQIKSDVKQYFVYKAENGKIEFIGDSKDVFQEYLDKNYSDYGLNYWNGDDINDSIETGDAAEDHPIAIEIFDNGNTWVYCYPEHQNILYTQKQFDEGDELSVDMGKGVIIYFRELSILNPQEKQLIK